MLDLFVSQDKDIDSGSITISGATITGTSGEFGDAVSVEIVNNTINISGLMPGPWSGTGLQLTYIDGGMSHITYLNSLLNVKIVSHTLPDPAPISKIILFFDDSTSNL